MDNKEVDVDIENDPAILMHYADLVQTDQMDYDEAIYRLGALGLTEGELIDAITVWEIGEYED